MAKPQTTNPHSHDGLTPSSDPADHRGKGKRAPERKCLVSGERLGKAELVRFVRSPDRVVTPDLAERLPGRGVWVSADRASLQSAIDKRAFGRGFKDQVSVPDDLVDQVETRLLEKCVSLLGFARKASQIVSGADQVRVELQKHKPAWLLQASDGADDGRRQIRSMAKGLYGEVNLADRLTSAELGMAFGREHVVHALLKTGRFAHFWAAEYGRLCGFRPASDIGRRSQTDE